MSLTSQEVEDHLTALKGLLQDVGPVISKALTQLVLQRGPGATPDKAEALRFLALQLASESVSECPVPNWPAGGRGGSGELRVKGEAPCLPASPFRRPSRSRT